MKSNSGFYRLVPILVLLTLLTWGVSAHPEPVAAAETKYPHPAPTTFGNPTIISITDDVLLDDVTRLGLNIGARNQYGSAQYLKNIIPNPGFEAGEFAMIFLTQSGATGTRLQADFWDTSWNNDPLNIGHPLYFWNGGSYEIINGPAAGRSGTIANFLHDDNRYTFYLDSGGTAPDTGDVVFVKKAMNGYMGDSNAYNVAETTSKRPGSSGDQSLKLLPSPGFWEPSFRQAFDSYGRDQDHSAGHLFNADGDWHLSLWAKATTTNDTLRIVWQRSGGATFFEETVALTTNWQQITRNFSVPADTDVTASPNALLFELHIDSTGDSVYVDDVVLERSGQTNTTEFSDNFVAKLQEYQPGIIRNWGNQLGSSLDNQLADQFSRKTTVYSPKDRIARNEHYSLHSFLELCQLVGADPWYVVPPTFSQAELENLMAYLGAPAGSHGYADWRAGLGQSAPWTDVFDTIHLEYGNEVWGANSGTDPFLGATLRGGINAGQVASDRIGMMKASPYYVSADFNFVIGGQAFYPLRQDELENNSSNHDTIGLAPYYGKLYNYSNDFEKYNPLYAQGDWVTDDSFFTDSLDYIDAVGQGTNVAVYEINLHAVDGSVPLSIRNEWLAGQGAGISLPLTMLHYQADLGIREILAYRELQFSRAMSNGEYARVWGMLRDLEATGNKRPTWLGVELANRAIMGDLITTAQSGSNPLQWTSPVNGIDQAFQYPTIQSFAYSDGATYSLIMFNLDYANDHAIQIDMPSSPLANATLHTLSADSITASNEDAEDVSITTTALTDLSDNYPLMLDAHSMAVLTWTSSTAPTAVGLDSVSAENTYPLWLPLLVTLLLIGTITQRRRAYA